MLFCQRCGEPSGSEKCIKCAKSIQGKTLRITAPQDTSGSTLLADRWKKSYMESVVGLDALVLSDTGESNNKTLRPSSSTPVVCSQSPNKHKRARPPAALVSSFFESKKKVGPLPTPVQTSLSTTKTTNDRGTCAECNTRLGGKTVRLPNTQTRYHWKCLTCAQCREPFQATSFHADTAGNIYHPKCYSSLRMDHTKACGRCSSDIRGGYLLIRDVPLHPQCFRCTSCKKLLRPSTLYIDTATSAYCQPCGKAASATTALGYTKIVPQLHVPRFPMTASASTSIIDTAASDQVKPSSLMSRRITPLPPFGVRRVCAGCNESIVSVHEEKPGPRATRWHTKCLRCRGCAKMLDSAAVAHENATTGGLDPWCRLCLLAKNKPQQSQRTSTATQMPVRATSS
ncbi:hypothetical protein BX666DRAFT_1962374 [Dichotomocladium elegans]|nr:hypothetical protein BX666DRAFT_1962374 [Dichotomocladium elegans]